MQDTGAQAQHPHIPYIFCGRAEKMYGVLVLYLHDQPIPLGCGVACSSSGQGLW